MYSFLEFSISFPIPARQVQRKTIKHVSVRFRSVFNPGRSSVSSSSTSSEASSWIHDDTILPADQPSGFMSGFGVESRRSSLRFTDGFRGPDCISLLFKVFFNC